MSGRAHIARGSIRGSCQAAGRYTHEKLFRAKLKDLASSAISVDMRNELAVVAEQYERLSKKVLAIDEKKKS
jgi:hypothetical protein